jgi:hypothetical protein
MKVKTVDEGNLLNGDILFDILKHCYGNIGTANASTHQTVGFYMQMCLSDLRQTMLMLSLTRFFDNLVKASSVDRTLW